MKEIRCMHLMAEWRGFEPPDPAIEINALAGRRIQPALPPLHIILVGRSGVEPLFLDFQSSTPTVYVTYPR